MRASRVGVALTGIIASALIVTGCSSTPSAPSTPGGPTAVTMLKGGALGFAPSWVAQEKGFFAEENIDVTLQANSAGSTADSAALLVSGDFTLVPSNIGDVANASLQGIPLQMVVSMNTVGGPDDGENSMIVKSDGPDSLVELAEPGTVLGITGGEKAVLGVLTRYAIDQAGGDSTAVQIQSVPFPQIADSVLNGTVAGGPLIQPFLTRAEADPGLKNIGSITSALAPNSPQVGLVATEQWVADNPTAVTGVQNAIAKAIEWMGDPANEEEFQAILAEYLSMDPASVAMLTTLPHYSATMGADATQTYLDIWTEYGALPSEVDANELVADGVLD